MQSSPASRRHLALTLLVLAPVVVCAESRLNPQQAWKPNTDWGHWRLGHRTDLEFLEKNRFTITFGSGAPNFETAVKRCSP